MAKFIIKRILISFLVVFLISTAAFALIRMLPGDPAQLALGAEASAEDIQRLREEYNLDKPIITQYFLWVNNLIHGNLGKSLTFKRDISVILKERLPVTLSLSIPSLVLSSIIGITLGVLCAVNRGRVPDKIITFISTLGVGTPVFWIGIIGIYLFAMQLRILPLQGYTSPRENFGLYVQKAILPVFCMSLGLIADVTRQTRSNMLEIVYQDYIRTSRANGLSEPRIILKYALRNALIPVLTIIAMKIRTLVGGSVLTERLFNIPGVGTIIITAVNNRDYTLAQACIFLISFVTVLCNLFVDIVYGIVDPRIAKSRG